MQTEQLPFEILFKSLIPGIIGLGHLGFLLMKDHSNRKAAKERAAMIAAHREDMIRLVTAYAPLTRVQWLELQVAQIQAAVLLHRP